jgi:hypothetical protein
MSESKEQDWLYHTHLDAFLGCWIEVWGIWWWLVQVDENSSVQRWLVTSLRIGTRLVIAAIGGIWIGPGYHVVGLEIVVGLTL